jgi:hypothetical protein
LQAGKGTGLPDGTDNGGVYTRLWDGCSLKRPTKYPAVKIKIPEAAPATIVR